jgi:demethylmenaquinone methyltransferase / 2-methoxy-6-polyprenyl-1,4-benzoquinol methylase
VTATGEFSAPVQNPPDPAQVRALFDWLAPNYDFAVLTYSLAQDLRWKSDLVRRLKPRPGENALDLACGTGLLYDRLVRVLGPKAVVGIDVNRAMLAGARAEDSGRRLVRADAVQLPFRDAAFDLVTAGYLLKYVPLDRLSEEICRILRPGGRFGGYDFSAPIQDSAAGWAYERYLNRVLPALGRRLHKREDGWNALMEFLAKIAMTSGWESRIEQNLRNAGFDRVDKVPSLGGAITWVWAWLPPARD